MPSTSRLARLAEKGDNATNKLESVGLGQLREASPFWMDETSGPLHGCYLEDFCRHLNGEMLRNRRALLERMAVSLRRVLRERCFPGISRFFDMVGAEHSLHTLDGISDRYWEYKVYCEQGHVDAWQMAWKQAEEVISRCDGAGGVQEQQGGEQGQGKDDQRQSKDEWCLID